MLNLRLDYHLAVVDDRLRATRDPMAPVNRGVKRPFRLSSTRPAGRGLELR